MIARVCILALAVFFCSCASSSSGKKTVKPRYHHSYYKKHVYFKHVRVGRMHLKLFEKQGVKTVKKN
jgi:hypothetical protein